MTQLKFSKHHGLGNDFVIIDGIYQDLPTTELSDLARHLCDRHFGIGADGLVIAQKAKTADLKMTIINADGSRAEMCGNGLRCLVQFAAQHRLIAKESVSIETDAGLINARILHSNAKQSMISVDMGEPEFEPKKIPFSGTKTGPVLEYLVQVGDQSFKLNVVSMGNPHAVIFVPELNNTLFNTYGPQLATHISFPKGANIEFVQVLSPNHAKVQVWERGAGPTLACGTGACAVTVAGQLLKKLDRNCQVSLPGGDLEITWEDTNRVTMMGPSVHVFSSDITL